MIKLIAIDLDDTLFDDKKQISKDNITAIQEATKKGIKIVISSGRPEIGIKNVLKRLGILNTDTYFIAYNGTRVYHELDDKLIYENNLTGADIKKIYRILPDNLYMHFYNDKREVFANKLNKYTEYAAGLNGIGYKEIDINTLNDDDKFIKLLFTGEPKYITNIINKIDTEYPEYKENYSLTQSDPIFYEFLANGVSKGSALKQLMDYLHLKQDEVSAIGDNDNDLEMLEVAGLKVAMQNSKSQKVLNEANFITKDNNHSGVAYAINYILKRNE